MTKGCGTDTSHYAVLIGIDAYPSSPLNSCVRDVEAIKKLLEDQLSSVDVQTLKASRSPTTERGVQADDPEVWPTCRNLELAFERVTSRAKPGELVYIHYSGHGTRTRPCFDLSNKSTGDLALVLLEGEQSKNVILRGPRLASLLKSMTDKGLIVTIVLDCCFSASVYRNSDLGDNIRFLPYDFERSQSLLDLDDDFGDKVMRSGIRDGCMRDNWLVNPDRYTILAACGPHENAKGGFDIREKSQRYGILSYFLIKSLSDHGLKRRHKDIHRHLCARFRQSCVPQHPVLYGNGEQGFFGQVDLDGGTRPICIVKRDDSIQLLAGRAHGIHEGDSFNISPSVLKANRSAEKCGVAKITRAGPLTSDLRLLDIPPSLQTGWIAEPLTSSYLARFYVQLAPNLPCYEQLVAALSRRSIAVGTRVSTDQVPALQIRLGLSNDYEIRDASGLEIISIPVIQQDASEIDHICNVVEHVARFRMIRDLVNETPTTALQESCQVQIVQGERAFRPGELIEARHNSPVEVTVNNTGPTVLYAHVYDLGPCWQVKNILRGTYEAIPPQKHPSDSGGVRSMGRTSRKIKMTVPPVMHKQGFCMDIIKIFITSQATSFDSLELPNLDELAKKKAGGRLTHPGAEVSEDWMVANFLIRTSI
ncbi:hypothetical protein FDECE_11286 [Fusarium decemcellulare]|nr:hypothetical protein FDECE_11286 [Fusarium decemcellulare]